MRIEWNKVTWYSRLIALVLFVALPILGFYFGEEYEKTIFAVRLVAPVYHSAENWKTYKDGLGRFEFQYPQEGELNSAWEITFPEETSTISKSILIGAGAVGCTDFRSTVSASSSHKIKIGNVEFVRKVWKEKVGEETYYHDLYVTRRGETCVSLSLELNSSADDGSFFEKESGKFDSMGTASQMVQAKVSFPGNIWGF